MAGEIPSGVVVGRITKAEKHPQADRLQVCEVEVGQGAALSIVCGAPNARVGLQVPCAKVGARLPGGLAITQAKLRGVESFGMLCSAKELGLSEKSEGLLELDNEAKPGTPIEQYLSFEDAILNLELTPNRGDCLSVLGLARELSAIYALNLKRPSIPQTVVVGHHTIKVEVEDAADCPHYSGRVISKLNPKARTPDWMRERLRRSGLRCIHPVVDITNYVMLELGQPLHAFDTAKLTGPIRVRKAKAGESLALLSGDKLTLNHGELLIADDKGPLALAGVMGGTESGVGDVTASIFFESACFAPAAVAGTARRHKLSSDASYRFERGVDSGGQRAALERATQLTLQICGGEVHPITQAGRLAPEPVVIRLRHARVRALLGHDIPAKEIEALLARLGITTRHEIGDAWVAKIPSHRNDLRIEHDLIEEIARLYGYDNIPAQPYRAALAPGRPQESLRSLAKLKDGLIARGWSEVVSLAFADPRVQQRLAPEQEAIPLDNPMAETLSVMRTTLWAGLLPAWLHNQARQVERVRLFESGVCFNRADGKIVETTRIAGLAVGANGSEQWGSPQRETDFFDVKREVEALLGPAYAEYRFEKAAHPAALHPGQCAQLWRGSQSVGWIGRLHPQVVEALALPATPTVFELDWHVLQAVALPRAPVLSEFPSSRRDLALVVPESLEAGSLTAAIRAAGGNLLSNVRVFDIYRGKGLQDGCKSIALGLIFKDNSRTLTLEEIDAAVAKIAQAVQGLNAVIRT